MMAHRNYFEIEANSYFELGLRKGELFGEFLRETVEDRRDSRRWEDNTTRAREYVGVAAANFPHLMDELRGYAQAARVPFDELWALSLEDEVGEFYYERCTTIVTNSGSLIAHNEDWDDDAQDTICLLRKKVGDLQMLELYYLNTLGGNAISINSRGFVHAVNSVSHTDRQLGVPKNVVARWLSETRNPDADLERMARLKRGSGFHHTVVSFDGKIWSLECSATQQTLTRPTPPFVHTNHYLTNIAEFEGDEDDGFPGTRSRYRSATEQVSGSMSVDGVTDLVSNRSEGRSRSIFNRRTIARMIIDIRNKTAKVWLLREEEKGWISYNIDQLVKS